METDRKGEKMKLEKRGIGGEEGRHLGEHLIEFHHPYQTNGVVRTRTRTRCQNKDVRGESTFSIHFLK